MPVINDPWTEESHLRKLLLEQQAENKKLADRLFATRQEADDLRRENGNLKAEVNRTHADLRTERERRLKAEQALAVHRKVQSVGEEMLAAVQINNANRNGGRN